VPGFVGCLFLLLCAPRGFAWRLVLSMTVGPSVNLPAIGLNLNCAPDYIRFAQSLGPSRDRFSRTKKIEKNTKTKREHPMPQEEQAGAPFDVAPIFFDPGFGVL
jgi:hypothetical protein